MVAVAAMVCVPATAGAVDISGEANGLSWQAKRHIVGQTSTATGAGGGDPIYNPVRPFHNGTVALIMDYGAGGRFICSGSLLSDRRSIATAGHCVSGGAGTDNPLTTTAYFYEGPDPDAILPSDPSAVAIDVTEYFVNPEYTGEVIDQNDIAVLRLAEFAPDFATAYDIYEGGDLTGEGFNVAGVGGRSDTGGAVGANLGTGRLRQGDNEFDFALGDSDFGGFFTDFGGPGMNFFGGVAEIDFSYVSDFDNGLFANDTSCLVAGAFGLGGPKYCGVGVGATEVGTAGGDSGGPAFIDGRLAGITSYGLSFGTGFGDFDTALNSSFGEFSGFVPTFIHSDFIRGAMFDVGGAVPEPATWALMIGGFGLAGLGLRRRRKVFA
jgi:hypothetical protein